MVPTVEKPFQTTVNLLRICVIVQILDVAFASQCFGPPLNHIFSTSQEDFYCPWYRNLVRHVPVEEGLCPSSSISRKYNNCLSDKECPKESYCCFSICHGITRCYNPYNNEWAEKLPDKYKPPCPPVEKFHDAPSMDQNQTDPNCRNEAGKRPIPPPEISLGDSDEESMTKKPITTDAPVLLLPTTTSMKGRYVQPVPVTDVSAAHPRTTEEELIEDITRASTNTEQPSPADEFDQISKPNVEDGDAEFVQEEGV